MISGSVNARREAVVRLRVRGPRGVETHVDALIDTGFDDELTLPASTIKTLGLLWWSQSQAHFADGSGRWFDIDSAEVEWDGAWRPIRISAIGDEVLLGMGMLLQRELRVRVVPGGAVEIDRTPQKDTESIAMPFTENPALRRTGPTRGADHARGNRG